MSKFNFNKIVKNVLNESFNDVEYHFTSLSTACFICRTNTIPLAPTLGKKAEVFINGNNTYFISFTRRRSSNVGYSKGRNVRIEFYGDLLNQQFKGKAIDYWGNSMGKQSLYRKLYNYNDRKKDPNIPLKYNNAQAQINNLTNVYGADDSSNESEDRLLTNKPYITNAKKYIKSIDILINPSNQKQIIAARQIFNSYLFRGKVNIYDNDHDFNSIRGKNINDKFVTNFGEEGEYSNFGKIITDDNYYGEEFEFKNEIKILSFFFAFLYLNKFIDKPNFALTIKKMLKSDGLGNYLKFINLIIKSAEDKIINNRYSSEIKSSQYFEDIVNSAYNLKSENGQEIVRFLIDWFKSQKFKKLDDLEKVLNLKNSHSDNDLYDFTTVKKFITYGRILIPNPDKDDFWTVIGYDDKNNKEYFTDCLEDYAYQNNIPIRGNRNTFHKYMQHLWRKCSVSQMINVIQSITGNAHKWIYEFLGKDFKIVNLNLLDAEFDYHLPNHNFYNRDEEQKELKKLFLKQ